MDNLKEFKELILLYESVTLEQLQEETITAVTSNKTILEDITGFGSLSSCKLCTAVKAISINKVHCNKCMWKIKTNNVCTDNVNADTYYAIAKAETLEDLLDAIQKRADYMRNVIDWFEEEI